MFVNFVNMSFIYYGGKLFVLNEGGKFWEFWFGLLEIVGEFDYEGGLIKG